MPGSPFGFTFGRNDIDLSPVSGTVYRSPFKSMNKFAIGCGGLVLILLFVAFLVGLFFWGRYNKLVTLDQEVNKKWGDVQSVYQRRADLIPNLVNTVQGAANFEK